MTTNTLLLFISVLIAGGLSYFQYIYKAKQIENRLVLAFFFIHFGILLLLINPILTKTH
jgi:hypothetical protein